MILIDQMLQKRRSDPIRVAMVGAGFMGRGIALQIQTAAIGMKLVAIANRSIEAALRAYCEAGVPSEDIRRVESDKAAAEALSRGYRIISSDPHLICRAERIDAVIEVTGTVEFAAGVVLSAIRHGKHVIVMNAELDGTVGPILKLFADRAGVVFTNSDGDQPGVLMNLFRFVKGIGLRPVLCGNIKGLHDPHRNPATQEQFARRWGQKASMVTSFADGTKISFEQAIVANATGMRVGRRGMYGPTVEPGTPLKHCLNLFPLDELGNGPGWVDYIVGAEPSPGVFIFGEITNPVQRHYLNLYKLGEGPLYCFYRPYHLCHFEVPNSVARAVLCHDATIAPLGAPLVDVIATAKIDLTAGQTLDGLGGFMTYGQCENSDVARQDRLLPIGLAEGCQLIADVPKDQILTCDDVVVPEGRLCDRLRRLQDDYFQAAAQEPTLERSEMYLATLPESVS